LAELAVLICSHQHLAAIPDVSVVAKGRAATHPGEDAGCDENGSGVNDFGGHSKIRHLQKKSCVNSEYAHGGVALGSLSALQQ
jgi:hypothetical protein